MSRQLKLRFAKPEESEQIIDWLNQHQDTNQYNPDILKSPSLTVLCSYNGQGPQQYILLDKVLMLDASAPKPGLDSMNAAQSFRDFTKAALLLASGQGIRYVYALDCGDGLDEMAKNHHYELVGKKLDNGDVQAFKLYRITV